MFSAAVSPPSTTYTCEATPPLPLCIVLWENSVPQHSDVFILHSVSSESFIFPKKLLRRMYCWIGTRRLFVLQKAQSHSPETLNSWVRGKYIHYKMTFIFHHCLNQDSQMSQELSLKPTDVWFLLFFIKPYNKVRYPLQQRSEMKVLSLSVVPPSTESSLH